MGTAISTSLFNSGRCVVISSGRSPQANSVGLILALPLTDCVTWGFHLHLSVPQFPGCEMSTRAVPSPWEDELFIMIRDHNK